MSLWPVASLIAFSLVLAVALLYWLSRRLEKREPYGSFIRLRTRQKVRFLRLLVTDKRVPPLVKTLPFLLLPYLAFPIDLIPDFIPVLGYVDDVAIVLGTFALIIRLTPRPIIDDLFRLAALPDQAPGA
jgi:uncharacterized membrane protein YkvA (DUF1232 family)